MAAGRALLLLLPSEREAMLAQLGEAKVPLKQIKPNPAKQQAVTPALQALLSKDQELKVRVVGGWWLVVGSCGSLKRVQRFWRLAVGGSWWFSLHRKRVLHNTPQASRTSRG